MRWIYLKTYRNCGPARLIWGSLADPREIHRPGEMCFLPSWHCLPGPPSLTRVNYLNLPFFSNFKWLTTFHCNFNTSLPRKMWSRHIKRSCIRNVMCMPFFIFKGRLQCIRNRYNTLDFSFLVKSCLIWLISIEQEFNTRSFKWDHSYINEIQTDSSKKKNMIKKLKCPLAVIQMNGRKEVVFLKSACSLPLFFFLA